MARGHDGLRGPESGTDGTPPFVPSVRLGALNAARLLLAQSCDTVTAGLGQADDAEIQRRLAVVGPDGLLTPIGHLAFVARDEPCLEYVWQPHARAAQVLRLRWTHVSLLEELCEVLALVTAAEATSGLITTIQPPPIAARRGAREAILHALTCRDWSARRPTLIRHIGHSLRVTNSRDVVKGVTTHAIRTHGAPSHHRELTDLFSALGLAGHPGTLSPGVPQCGSRLT